jgi:hypothetical protein
MIGAILPHGAQAWFLKLAGPPAALDSHLEPFRQWLRSIHFVDDKPQWQLPQGWREEPGQGMRFATLRIGDGEPLELTVIPLPIPEDDPDYVLSNVNRWRQQLQLGPLTAPQLGEQAEKIQVGDAVATLVDLRSEGTPNK